MFHISSYTVQVVVANLNIYELMIINSVILY